MTSELFTKIISRNLMKHLKEKRPNLFTDDGQNKMILHMDNARPHTAHLTRLKLQMLGIETLPHAPYSPDISPCDFWLFKIVKNSMKGCVWSSDNELIAGARSAVNSICRSDYSACYDSWIKRWRSVIQAEGSYFDHK